MATQRAVQQDLNEEGKQGSMYPGKGHQARPLWQGAGRSDFMDCNVCIGSGLCSIVAQNQIVIKYTYWLQMEHLLLTELLVQASPRAHSHDYCVMWTAKSSWRTNTDDRVGRHDNMTESPRTSTCSSPESCQILLNDKENKSSPNWRTENYLLPNVSPIRAEQKQYSRGEHGGKGVGAGETTLLPEQ